jgi:iron(III) transport system substrate-binding protein
VLSVLGLFASAACSGGDEGGDESAGHVTIYSGRTQNLVEPILDRFAEETGIDVDVRYGQSSDLALLIEEEGERTPADVFLSQSPGSVGFLDQQGRLGTLPQDVLDLVPAQLRAADGAWVGFSGRKRVLAYNPARLAASELPTSVLELTQPQWRGRVGVAPANASFQDFVTAMRLDLGDEATHEWLQGIAANDAFTFANNNAIVAAVGRGEVDLGLVNHYYVFQALAEDPAFQARNHHLAPDDIGSLVIVTAASVLGVSDHHDEAVALVRYLLGEEAQRYFSEQTYEYPLAAGVPPADVLPPIEFVRREGVNLDQLGGGLESTRDMIRDVGLEG